MAAPMPGEAVSGELNLGAFVVDTKPEKSKGRTRGTVK